MGAHAGPNAVEDGLILCLDAANSKSYPGTGSTWVDLSGNDNNGTLVNGPTFSSENQGILTFDGADDYITAPNASYSGDQTHSVDLWFKIDTLDATRRWLLVLGNYSAGNFHMIYASSNFQFGQWDGNQTSPTFSSGVWNNCIMTYDGSTLKCYKNSVLVDSTAVSAFNFSNFNVSLGLRLNPEGYYSGDIGRVGIYDKALSESEIQQNFNALRGRYGI